MALQNINLETTSQSEKFNFTVKGFFVNHRGKVWERFFKLNWIGNHLVKSKRKKKDIYSNLENSKCNLIRDTSVSLFIHDYFRSIFSVSFQRKCISVFYLRDWLSSKVLKRLNTQFSVKIHAVKQKVNRQNFWLDLVRVETIRFSCCPLAGQGVPESLIFSIRPTDKRCLFLHATLVWSFSNPRPPPFLCCPLSSATHSFLPLYTKNLVLKVRLSCLSLLWL